jgi:hypothetical protein
MPWQGEQRSELEETILNELEAGKFKCPKRDIPKSITTFSLSAINPSVMREAVELMDYIYDSYQSSGKSPPVKRDDYSRIKKKLEDLKRHRHLKEPERELDFKELREIGAYPKIKALLNTIKEACNDPDISHRVIDIKKRLVCKVIPNFKRNWEEIYSPNIYSCIFAERLQSVDSQTDCTKKYTPRGNSLASLLYILDKRIHLLFFDMGEKCSESNLKIPESPQALAILMETEDKNRRKYLLIEGVLSNEAFDELIPLPRFPNLPSFLNKTYKRAYHFVNDGIKKYAHWHGARRFLSTYQVQSDDEVGPLQYVDCLKETYRFRYNYDYEKLPADKEKNGNENGWLVPLLEDLVSHGKVHLTKSNFDLEKTLSEQRLALITNEKKESTYFTQAFTTANLESGQGNHGPWRKKDADGCWGECTGEVYGKDLSEQEATEKEYCPSEKYYISERKEHLRDEFNPTKALEINLKKNPPSSTLGKAITLTIIAAIGLGSYFALRDQPKGLTPSDLTYRPPLVADYTPSDMNEIDYEINPPLEGRLGHQELLALKFNSEVYASTLIGSKLPWVKVMRPLETDTDNDSGLEVSARINSDLSQSRDNFTKVGDYILLPEELMQIYDKRKNSIMPTVASNLVWTVPSVNEATPGVFLGGMVGLSFSFERVDNDYQIEKAPKKKEQKKAKSETITTLMNHSEHICAPEINLPSVEAGYITQKVNEGGTGDIYEKPLKKTEENPNSSVPSLDKDRYNNIPYKCKSTLCNKL